MPIKDYLVITPGNDIGIYGLVFMVQICIVSGLQRIITKESFSGIHILASFIMTGFRWNFACFFLNSKNYFISTSLSSGLQKFIKNNYKKFISFEWKTFQDFHLTKYCFLENTPARLRKVLLPSRGKKLAENVRKVAVIIFLWLFLL